MVEKVEGRAIVDKVETWTNVKKDDKIKDYVEKWISGKPRA